MVKKEESLGMVIGCVLAVMVFAALYLVVIVGDCEDDAGWGLPRKYYMDDVCFDWDYRCQVECGNYGRNFTGNMDGCACDCGDIMVSACSGFAYDKEEWI